MGLGQITYNRNLGRKSLFYGKSFIVVSPFGEGGFTVSMYAKVSMTWEGQGYTIDSCICFAIVNKTNTLWLFVKVQTLGSIMAIVKRNVILKG